MCVNVEIEDDTRFILFSAQQVVITLMLLYNIIMCMHAAPHPVYGIKYYYACTNLYKQNTHIITVGVSRSLRYIPRSWLPLVLWVRKSS